MTKGEERKEWAWRREDGEFFKDFLTAKLGCFFGFAWFFGFLIFFPFGFFLAGWQGSRGGILAKKRGKGGADHVLKDCCSFPFVFSSVSSLSKKRFWSKHGEQLRRC